MDNTQAIHAFWNSFDVPVYDENTVPDDAQFPRITYDIVEGVFGSAVTMSASIWDRRKSWSYVETIKDRVRDRLKNGGQVIATDDGGVWLTAGSPFMQRVAGDDDMIRRILINVDAEYIV